VSLFTIFGIGAILASPLVLILRTPDRCQPLIRALWRLIVRLFVLSGMISVDSQGIPAVRGTVIAANHPSLIDVVLLVAAIPHSLYVAKHALRRNPVLAAIVRATALPDDARLPEVAKSYLDRGWNVVVFPEGTRSPDGGLNVFRRGTVQLALRTGAPLLPVGIRFARRILGKGQRPWDVGEHQIRCTMRTTGVWRPSLGPGENLHRAAVRETEELERRIRAGMALAEVDG